VKCFCVNEAEEANLLKELLEDVSIEAEDAMHYVMSFHSLF
jgi:hypothetical protein